MRRLWTLCLLMACSGDTTDDDPPVPTQTADTFVTSTGWTPVAFSVAATFGYDSETSQLHSWTIEGSERFPVFALVIWSEDFDEQCSLIARVDDPSAVSVESWAFRDETVDIDEASMQHWGWVLPTNVTIGTSGEDDCDTWDDVQYGDLEDLITEHIWGVGVGTLRSDLAEAALEFEDDMAAARDAGNLFGGSWLSDVWSPTTWASHVAVGGKTTDWAMTFSEDGQYSDPVTQAEIETGLPTGVYNVVGVYGWDFDTYLP